MNAPPYRARLRRILGSPAVATVGTTLVIIGLGLVNSVCLSRWLGPEGRGAFAAALLWPMLLAFIGSMGLPTAILYRVAQPDGDVSRVLGVGWLLALVQSAATMAIGYAAIPWLLGAQEPGVVWMGQWFLLVIPLSLVTQYGVAALQARLRFANFNAVRMVMPVGGVLITAVLWASGRLSPLTLVAGQLLLNIMALLMMAWGVRSLLTRPLAFEAPLGRQLLSYGLKVQLGDVSQSMNLRLDQVVMAASLPSASLGLYVAAVSAAGLGQVLGTGMKMVVMPKIAATPRERRLEALGRTSRLFVVANAVVLLGLFLSMPTLIPLVFGAAFEPAVRPALILVFGTFFLGLKDVLAGGVQALGDPWLVSRSEIVGLVVTVPSVALLVPTLAIEGAAIASVLAYGSQLAVVVMGLRGRWGFPPSRLLIVTAEDLALVRAQLAELRAS